MRRMGIVTSGGDAPGMNACIRAFVRTACTHGVEVFGVNEGLQGLVKNKIRPLTTNDVANIIHRGGTFLQSSRSTDFMTFEGRKTAFQNLKSLEIEALACIGGDGSYTAMKTFEEEFSFPTVGCPGTIDNDIFGTDYTIGFDTAINNVVQSVDKIRDTAESHNNVFFIEVMGRFSGNIALFSGISSGAESVLIPEITNDFDNLVSKFKNKQKRKKRFSIVIVAEGDEEGNAFEIANKFKNIFPDLNPKVTVLGHIQRGGAPTANDRILASKLGAAAVDSLLNNKSNTALGMINNRLVFTNYSDAISKKKEFNYELFRLAEILSL